MLKRSIISGTIVLILAGFVVRILGFFYRIYLSNLIGAEGMGLFQLIFPLYSLIILTLTSGISIAVSKLVATELAVNHLINLRRITSCALIMVVSAGIVVSALIVLYVDFITNFILRDSRTYYSLILLIPCIPVIAAASAIKGYFYGVQNTVPTAISQIVEQGVKIGLVVALAGWFLNVELQYACAIATLGMALGEIANLAVLYILYNLKKNKTGVSKTKKGFKRKRHIIKEILSISIPISFNRFVTSIMFAVETILIPSRLLASGLGHQQSMEQFGRMTGMAMPLVFFPSLVTSALATTLVPAISEELSLKKMKSVNSLIAKSIKLTLVLGFVFTAIFICFPNDIGDAIYKNQNIGSILYALSFTGIFLYLQQTLLGIMNGLDKQTIAFRNSLVGNSIRILFVYFFIPIYGVIGYIWGIFLSSAIVCVLNLSTVIKTTGLTLDLRNWFIKPGSIGIVMVFSGKYIYSFYTFFTSEHSWVLLFTISTYLIMFTALIIFTGTIERDELIKILKIKRN